MEYLLLHGGSRGHLLRYELLWDGSHGEEHHLCGLLALDAKVTNNEGDKRKSDHIRWIQAILGHTSIELTQIYTQISIRALQTVHASTHPAEQETGDSPTEDNMYNDNTVDTTKARR